jgi:ion channel POLLUX/CASTOR
MNFDGDEIYFQEEPALLGRTFADALFAYEDSAVIGLCPAGGLPRLNPPMDTRIAAGDRIIAISEDDDTVRLSGLARPAVDDAAIRHASSRPAAPESTLVLGWNWRAPLIVRELDAYVAPGSRMLVVGDLPDLAARIPADLLALGNIEVESRTASTTERRVLDGLDPASFNHVIVLSYLDDLDVQRADARTLVTLLHLRDIELKGGRHINIVSEMLDIRNRNLAEVTKADDFVVSDNLISLMLSQVAENKLLKPVFDDLFDPEGSEIYLKPAADYVAPGVPVSFYTVLKAAAARSEVAIGYRLHHLAEDASQAHGVVVNPDKSRPVTFAADDKVIVLAES